MSLGDPASKYPSIIKTIGVLTAGVIVLAGMHLAASFLLPVMLGGFFAVLLSPINRWLKRRLPSGIALLLSILVLALAALFLLMLIGNSLTTLAGDLAGYSEQFATRQAELETASGSLEGFSIIQTFTSALDPERLASVLKTILDVVLEMLNDGILILLVTMFVLAEAPQFKKRMLKVYGTDHFAYQNMISLVRLIINYFGLRAIVNLVVAVGTGIMLWLFGIEHAGLWAVLTFFLSFVPYIGAVIAMIPPILLAYAQGGLGLTVVIVVLAIIINALSENIVAPILMGKGLSVSPTVVFISFVFWMFILGGGGAFIAMPLTVALILVMKNYEETRGLAAMMASTPNDEVS